MTKRKLTIGEEVFISGLGYIVWDEANEKALTELCEEIESIAPTLKSRFVCARCDAPVTPMGNSGHWKREHSGSAPLKWKRTE